jgi:UDP-N-acetylglucosamine 2-epimerase (non-hydrolysing)
MKIISVVGARPNFMKVAPIHKAFVKLNNKSIKHLICHTGQHYDDKMSKVFFDDLELPKPDYYLGAGSGSHAEQTAKVMIEFEKVLLRENPDLVLVVGDVNSTIACSLTAVKLGIKVAHVEAGLRSFDRKMPEEINRILTDAISDYLFVSEQSGVTNLKNEGIPPGKVFFVGQVMIDSLVNFLPKAEKSDILERLNVKAENYVLVTLHRPGNVDEKENLINLLSTLTRISDKRKIVFPVHPRTMKNIEEFGLAGMLGKKIIFTAPLGYLDFLKLLKHADFIMTDSGGIQEESTYLGVHCITIRTTTERPVTVETGTNYLTGDDYKIAEATAFELIAGNRKKGSVPDLWDGRAAERIVRILTGEV